MLTLAEVLAKFPSVRRRGKEYRTVCPVHGDDAAHPSLEITDGHTGIVFLCRTKGCAPADILNAVGLTWADVTPARATTTTPKIAAIYDYRDAAGVLRYQVVRQDPKAFRQRRPDSNSGWIWNMHGVDRLPYRLPELRTHARVFIPEGEKDVDLLWTHGLPATCNTGGAKKWGDRESAALKAIGVQRVVLLPDNDDEGHAHVKAAASSLTAAGLTVVALPPFADVATKGDISDWFALGHTVAELEALIAGVRAVPTPTFPGLRGVLTMAQEPQPLIRWVVEDRIPAGSVCLLVAKPKVGKTTAARHLAIAVARGEDWLGFPCLPGVVWYLAFEGQQRDHVAHFRQFNLTPEDDARLRCYVGPMTPDLFGWMHAEAKNNPPTLIIIDTFQRFVQVKSMDDYAEVTKAFDPLIAFTRDTGAALLLIHHAGKAVDRDPLDTVLGSTAIAGSVDNTLILAKRTGFRTITTRQRIGPDLDEHVIALATDGRVSLGEARDLADRRALMQSLYNVLAAAPEPMAARPLFESVEGRRQSKVRAMAQLVADGLVLRDGTGKPKNPYIYSVPLVPSVPSVPSVPICSQAREQTETDIFEI